MGRLVHGLETAASSPVGRMFIQPRVATANGHSGLLDDFVGLNFCILAWGTDPSYGMDEEALNFWQRLGARFIRAMPSGQLLHPTPTRDGVLTVGDEQGRLKDWFSAQGKSVVFVRPDRFVAALASPQEVSTVTRQMARVLHSPLEA